MIDNGKKIVECIAARLLDVTKMQRRKGGSHVVVVGTGGAARERRVLEAMDEACEVRRGEGRWGVKTRFSRDLSCHY
jgi:hypothetical protein